jgi:hypothetical protein
MQIRKAQPSDFKCLVEIFTLNIPKYFHEKELVDFKNSKHCVMEVKYKTEFISLLMN